MLRLLARRLGHALAVVLLATTTSFALLHLAPGDPIAATLDHPAATDALRATLRAQYGLDRPVAAQLGTYLAGAARGDLGWSFSQQRPVARVLADALPATILLTGTALVLAFAAGIALGALQGWRPRARSARLVGLALTAVHAVPEFIVALALLGALAVRLPLLPAGGMHDPVLAAVGTAGERAADLLRHLVLPATTLALGWAAVVARHQRLALRAVAGEDFVRTARAKGVGEGAVLARHALRPALAPVATLAGLALPTLAGGAVVVEALFAWPGMGLVATQAVAARDYPLVTGTVLVASTLVAAGAVLADLVRAALDPRLRDAVHGP